MFRSLIAAASVLAFASVASAQTQYNPNTNTNCATGSDVVNGGVYSYALDDTMDFGFYTQSTGTCDQGSYAPVHIVDPDNNDIPCDSVALDGVIHLVNCPTIPRNTMKAGVWTIYWETVPSANQYSWNQFTVSHSQSTVTVTGATSTITTTPITVVSTTVTSTATDTKYLPQETITTYASTKVNTVKITPPVVTITTGSTVTYTFTIKKHAVATTTAQITAPCKPCDITPDWKGTRPKNDPKPYKYRITKQSLFDILARLHILRVRGQFPNKVGMEGQPLTTTITPDVVVTTVTAETSTNTVTSTSVINGGTITIADPTPTVTAYKGVKITTTTITLPQSTSSIVKNKCTWTLATTTVTWTVTKKVYTTDLCDPKPIKP